MTITQRKTITALQKSLEKNAIKLYDKRTDIINAFANKDNFPKNLKLDDYLFDDLKSKPKFGESIAERIKREDKNNLTMNNQILQICLI